MRIPLEQLLAATKLTRSGRLAQATATIRHALGMDVPVATGQPRQQDDVIDVPSRAMDVDAPAHPTGSFTAHTFAFEGNQYVYRLYVPSGRVDQPLPLVVMLHGCKQDSADFAAGTQMNAQAEASKCLVLYPEQLQKANQMRCWNWFDSANQQRDRGEPAMIARLAQHIVATHNGDPARIYIAGLSAGGAMAALAGQLYPEVFAAVGVHSGLAAGAATNLPGALSAMRKGSTNTTRGAQRIPPTIVFHGTADSTVNPANADQIERAALASLQAAGVTVNATRSVQNYGSRDAARTIYSAPEGQPMLESWRVQAAAHAWSGGDSAGSYTDTRGPNASHVMLEFFLKHRNTAS